MGLTSHLTNSDFTSAGRVAAACSTTSQCVRIVSYTSLLTFVLMALESCGLHVRLDLFVGWNSLGRQQLLRLRLVLRLLTHRRTRLVCFHHFTGREMAQGAVPTGAVPLHRRAPQP